MNIMNPFAVVNYIIRYQWSPGAAQIVRTGAGTGAGTVTIFPSWTRAKRPT
jgi:hypothetical protein